MPIPGPGRIPVAGLILVAGPAGARNLALAAGARRPPVPRLPLRSPPRSPLRSTTPPAAPAGPATPIQALAQGPAPGPDQGSGAKPVSGPAQAPGRRAGLARVPIPSSDRGPGRNTRQRCAPGRTPPPGRRGLARNPVPARPGPLPRRALPGLPETTGQHLGPAAGPGTRARMRCARPRRGVAPARGAVHRTVDPVPGRAVTAGACCRCGSQQRGSWIGPGKAIADDVVRLPPRHRHMSSGWRRMRPARADRGGGRARTGGPVRNRPTPRTWVAVVRGPGARPRGAASAECGSSCWPSG